LTSFHQDKIFRLPGLYREYAQALLALGDVTGAAESLAQGIEECEVERNSIREEMLTQSYFDQEQGLYEDMIRLENRKGSAAAAFNYSERARARSLIDAIAASRASTPVPTRGEPLLRAADIRRLLPPGTVLIEYAQLEDSILAWALDARGLYNVPISLKLSETDRDLLRLRDHLDHLIWDAEAQRIAERFYDQLIRPFASVLARARAVVLVVDRELTALPFAVLRNAATGKFFIEEHAISYAPSANLWALALAAQPRQAVGALVVGDPALDLTAFPHLQSLPRARLEAERVAALYPGSLLLTDSAATPTAFLSEAPRFGVIHLASHALPSGFVLSPSRGERSDAGLLATRDLYRLRFDRTRLVVLAACDTTRGPLIGREGIAGLARPFLAGGVPLVVANLWEVDDVAALEILGRFHRDVAGGKDPVVALRTAQLAAIRSKGSRLASPSSWGGFLILGAGRSVPN